MPWGRRYDSPGRAGRKAAPRRVGASGTEATVPLAEGPQRPQEVDLAEVGPVGLAEVELAVRALPQQEAAEPLLARGADHQVRIRLALGVEVLRDVVDVD